MTPTGPVGRPLTADALARFGGLEPGRCLQARNFARLWPAGFDIDTNPAALLAAIPRIRESGLDIVYGAIYLSQVDVEVEGFTDLVLSQGEGLQQDRHLFQGRGAARAHPANKGYAYRLARLTRTAIRLQQGRDAEVAARNAQEEYWLDILRGMADDRP